jgi:hypothetical protein
MSQTESGASSPAPASEANTGDGKKTTAANVTAAEAVRLFVKASERQANAAQTADTPATSSEVQSSEQSPAAESAQPDSPEATTDTPAEGAPESVEDTTTTEGEGENAGEADEVLSPESQTLDAKTKERIQRRIDKEVGRRKALEAQLQQVQSQLQELATKPQPTQDATPISLPNQPAAPLPNVKTPADLESYRKEIKTAARNIEALLDRDDIDQGVQWGDKTWTKAELKALHRDARVTLEDTIPEQEKFFHQQQSFTQARQAHSKQAVADWPFLADPSSPEYKQVQQFKKEASWLNALPYGDWVAGAIVVGANELKARKEAGNAKDKDKSTDKAKPAVVIPKPKPPASQTVSSTSGSVPRNDPNQGRTVPKPQGNQTASSAATILRQREEARLAAQR